MDSHRRGKEGRIVKRDIALGDGVEDKFQVEGAAIFNHIVDADVTFVMAEAEIDLCGSAGLFGSVAQCVERTGRDAVDLWQIKTLLHKIIQYTAGIDSAKASAFQNKGGCSQIRHRHL